MKILKLILIVNLLINPVYSQNWISLTKAPHASFVVYGDTNSNLLFVSGGFDTIGNTVSKDVAIWNGKNWIKMGRGVNYDTTGFSKPTSISQFLRFGNKILVSGFFEHVGEYLISKNIALWDIDSNKWESLNWKPSSNVNLIYQLGDSTFIFGSYDSINGIKSPHSNYLFNGKWQNINPPNGAERVYCAIYYNGELYLGGNMNSTIKNADDIARWDGSRFYKVGQGIFGAISEVQALEVYNGELYIAGNFKKSAGNVGNNIMKWDGNKLSNVGDSDYWISDLEVHNGILYACGVFTTIGGIKANQIAWYDGNNWHALAGVQQTAIYNITFLNDTLYASRNTGNGFDVARYNKELPTSVKSTLKNRIEIVAYPNPVSNTLQLSGGRGNEEIEITEITGKLVIKEKYFSELNVSDWKNGIYIIKIKTDKNTWTYKIIKQ